jgi:hypothetical protein
MDRRWIDRIIATTGWTRTEPHPFDWGATEQQLGTRLPADYKELAEIFGPGMFGEWLGLFLPVDYEFYAIDIVTEWSYSLRLADQLYAFWSEPYGLHPKPGGLLQWGFTPDGHLSFYWSVESDDPDHWSVIVGHEDDALLDRYEHSTTEHVYRELADVLDRHSEHNLQGFITLNELTARDPPPRL